MDSLECKIMQKSKQRNMNYDMLPNHLVVNDIYILIAFLLKDDMDA